MKKQIIVILLIIPALLLAACGDKTKTHVIKITQAGQKWLGVSVKELSDKMLNNLDLDGGVEVLKVYRDSPAEKAGLEKYDILIRFDEKLIDSPGDLAAYVSETEEDQTISIEYLREREIKTAEVKIGERRSNTWVQRMPRKSFKYYSESKAWLGVRTDNIGDQLRQYFGAPEDLGVLVEEVIAESPAEKYGIKAGDVIIRVGKKDINSSRDLVHAINYHEPQDQIEIELIRNQDRQVLTVELGESKENERFRRFGVYPDSEFEFLIEPDIHVIPEEIEIEISPEDIEELKSVREKIRGELDIQMEELDEQLESLNEEIQRISIRLKARTV